MDWCVCVQVLVGHAYGMPVDIWAVGCIFAEMVTGAPLFPGASHLDQLYITIKGLGGLSKEQVATVKANKKLAAAAAGNTGRPIAEMEQQGTLFDRCVAKGAGGMTPVPSTNTAQPGLMTQAGGRLPVGHAGSCGYEVSQNM